MAASGLPRSAHTDCVGAFNANDFNLPTTIARIIVVQNLSRLEHDAPLPLWIGVKLSCPAKAGRPILRNKRTCGQSGQVSNFIQISSCDFGESGGSESTCVFKMRRSTRAQYAAPKPLLQRLNPTLCTSILRFTDTSVTGAGRSNPWLCFARRRFNQ
jgi:hypothetical protein